MCGFWLASLGLQNEVYTPAPRREMADPVAQGFGLMDNFEAKITLHPKPSTLNPKPYEIRSVQFMRVLDFVG